VWDDQLLSATFDVAFARVGRTLLSVGFDVAFAFDFAFDLAEIPTAASTIVEERTLQRRAKPPK